MNLHEMFKQAVAHHHAGRFVEAEELYHEVLKIEPLHSDANHNLGLMAMQLSQAEMGLSYLQTAWESDPSIGAYWLTLTECLLETGHSEDALLLIEDAIRRGIDLPQAQQLLMRAKSNLDTSPKSVETIIGENAAMAGRLEEGAQVAEQLSQYAFKEAPPVLPEITQANKNHNPAKPDKSAGKSAPHQKKNPSAQEKNTLVTLFAEGRYTEAEALAMTMAQDYPQHGFGWKVLGAVLKQTGRDADALAPMQKAAALTPSDAEVHNNLGVLLQAQGELKAALVSVRRALKLKPGYANAHNSLGSILDDLGKFDAAQSSYRKALEINPDFADAHNNLGAILKNQGQFDAAAVSFRKAIAIKPDYAEAHNNLGVTLQGMGRTDEAEACYRRALAIKPDYAEAHTNLGNVLNDFGQLDDAVASHRRALEFRPDFAYAHNNLGVALQGLGKLGEAAASFRNAMEIEPDYINAHSNLLFIHNYLSDQPASMLLDEAKRFGKLAARQAHAYTNWRNTPERGRCLRVGFVSGDLRNHPVGYFAEGVLAALASDASGQLKIVAYHNYYCTDALTERIKANCHGWHSVVGLSDESLARRIRDDGIDILIDLSGHTVHNRLTMFAWKPAPVQVSWLGYFATTGIAAMDYFIADPWALPDTEEINFTEKIWRLPESRLCFTPPDADVEVAPLPALNNGYVTFGCFNNLTKINDAVVALWARVLSPVPNSRLFLKSKQLKEASVRQSIVARFAAHGINADRLIMEGYNPRAEYLSAYQRVDIALDPFPFPGGTTSVESLWMGVPVLTLTGERLLSRQGVSLLMNVGLPEWIAADADDYVARAVLHAGDLQRLAILRNGLRQRILESPLFDAPRFAHHFEAALRGMWVQWCNQHQK